MGFGTGLDILSGSLGDTVSGVWLFEKLAELAGKNGWRVFLLGGWGDTAERTARMLLERFPGIIVDFDAGEKRVGKDPKKNNEVIEKINDFNPDLLCVTYRPMVQEKWIGENKARLKVKVAIGLGGTFNEFLVQFTGDKTEPVGLRGDVDFVALHAVYVADREMQEKGLLAGDPRALGRLKALAWLFGDEEGF